MCLCPDDLDGPRRRVGLEETPGYAVDVSVGVGQASWLSEGYRIGLALVQAATLVLCFWAAIAMAENASLPG